MSSPYAVAAITVLNCTLWAVLASMLPLTLLQTVVFFAPFLLVQTHLLRRTRELPAN